MCLWCDLCKWYPLAGRCNCGGDFAFAFNLYRWCEEKCQRNRLTVLHQKLNYTSKILLVYNKLHIALRFLGFDFLSLSSACFPFLFSSSSLEELSELEELEFEPRLFGSSLTTGVTKATDFWGGPASVAPDGFSVMLLFGGFSATG